MPRARKGLCACNIYLMLFNQTRECKVHSTRVLHVQSTLSNNDEKNFFFFIYSKLLRCFYLFIHIIYFFLSRQNYYYYIHVTKSCLAYARQQLCAIRVSLSSSRAQKRFNEVKARTHRHSSSPPPSPSAPLLSRVWCKHTVYQENSCQTTL